MPPYGVVLMALAAVLGTLCAAPAVSSDVRIVVAIAMTVLAVFGWLARYDALRALLFVTIVAASLNAWLRVPESDNSEVERRTARYAAIVLDATPAGDGLISLSLALDDGTHVLADVRSGGAFEPGSSVVVRGRLASFDGPRNPGEPSERALQRERGFDARLESAAVLSAAAGSPWDSRAWLARAHAWARDRLRDQLGEPYAAVLAGELWGERAALAPDLRAEFQETGTVHVLVTAGLHLGAVAALVCALLTLLGLPRTVTCGLAIICIWAFVVWSGAALPAERAATMATAALAARACGRATFSWNSLALGALALAFLRPESVATASFALSFSCVGAIFACAAPIERWIEARAALPARVREALVLTLATQLGTWPLTAAVFLQFSPYAVLANLAVVPCVAATMALGAAQLALAWCPPLAQACANINSWPLAWMLATVRTLSSLPFAAVPMTPAPAWCIALYDASLLAAPLLARIGARTAAVAGIIVAAGLVLWPPRAIDGRLRVTVLDVGQADSIVIQTPGEHAILVDAGGRLERGAQSADSTAEQVGERIVVPFLLRSGIHALDALIISHPHGDHVGGCSPVLRKIRVAEIADSGQTYGGHAYRDCVDTARARGVPIVHPRAGDEWQTDDGVTLQFIGPSLPMIANSRNDINENSIAFILHYKRFCMLFTGDAGAAAEQRFLGEQVDLRCEILKVGHHGSAYSSTPAFIAAVHPQYAVISVGRHNLFGHPAPVTLQTLRQFGTAVYRTDENAAITVTTDGTSVDAAPFAFLQHTARAVSLGNRAFP